MRGTLVHIRHIPGKVRIIPADAGNTTPTDTTQYMQQDHPRGCGEHPVYPPFRPHRSGSSPRMRGTPHLLRRRLLWLGIIPADAGNTIKPCRRPGGGGDHPRGCGEHLRPCPMWTWCHGSSPRMRGTPFDLKDVVMQNGIIPADAGNTGHEHEPHHASGDHPRGCGEHRIMS